MIELPKTKEWRWTNGEILTIDFGRTVDFHPNECAELAEWGRWIASDDHSKYYLVYRQEEEFPDRTIAKVLNDDLHLNGYEMVHSGATYAE